MHCGKLFFLKTSGTRLQAVIADSLIKQKCAQGIFLGRCLLKILLSPHPTIPSLVELSFSSSLLCIAREDIPDLLPVVGEASVVPRLPHSKDAVLARLLSHSRFASVHVFRPKLLPPPPVKQRTKKRFVWLNSSLFFRPLLASPLARLISVTGHRR